MPKTFDYGASGIGFGWQEVTVEKVIERIKGMEPQHRLSYLLSRFEEIKDYTPFLDIVPGLEDYLNKSGIFEGYFD